MKILRMVLILISLLVIAAFAAGNLLPTEIRVTRSIQIDAPIQRVFGILNSFEQYNQWSPWYELDPDAVYETLGQRSGVGARFQWDSPKPQLGSGSQEIIGSEPYHFVRVSMKYGLQGSGFSTYDLEASEQGTQMSWAYESDLGSSLITRYFGLALRKRIAADCENGLENLKRFAEASLEDSEGRSLEARLIPGYDQFVARGWVMATRVWGKGKHNRRVTIQLAES